MEVAASLSQGRTAAAQCGLFTHKSIPVIFEPPCILRRVFEQLVNSRTVTIYPPSLYVSFQNLAAYSFLYLRYATDSDYFFVAHSVTLRFMNRAL